MVNDRLILPLAHFKNAELEYEIDVLRKETLKKDKIIGATDLSQTILKIDQFLKEVSRIQLYQQFTHQIPSVSHLKDLEMNSNISEVHSLQSTGLISKINTLESQISTLRSIFKSPSFLKSQKEQQVSTQDPTSEEKEEIKILTAEKIRLETYMQVYSQRINSLSTVIIAYQNQFKNLFEKVKTSKGNHIFRICSWGLVYTEEDDDNQSFNQYRGKYTQT